MAFKYLRSQHTSLVAVLCEPLPLGPSAIDMQLCHHTIQWAGQEEEQVFHIIQLDKTYYNSMSLLKVIGAAQWMHVRAAGLPQHESHPVSWFLPALIGRSDDLQGHTVGGDVA